MKAVATRFGEIEIDKNLTIHFPIGLPGFPEQKDFTILEHKIGSPFCWLQSLSNPDLAFVMTDPQIAVPDYLSDLSSYEKYHLYQESDIKKISLFLP